MSRAQTASSTPSSLHFLVVGLAYFLQNVAHLMHPATLMPCPRIHRGDRGRQTRTAVGDDQRQVLAFRPAPIQILEQSLPIRLTFALAAQKEIGRASCRGRV